jgi:HK97 family phage major capsid protein
VQPVARDSIAMRVAHVVNTPSGVNDYRVPIVSNDPTVGWVAEGQEITPSDATLNEVSSKFYKLAGLTIISRELANDSSPEAAALVGAGLARDLARKLDEGFFGGAGTAARPAGIGSVGPSAFVTDAWANTDPFVSMIYNAEALGAPLNAFVANPADAEAMAKVKKAVGSNEPLLGNDPTQPTRRLIAGVPLLASPAVAVGTVWGVPAGRTIVVMHEDVSLEVDRSVYFTSDRVAVKATLRVAFLFPHENAVQKLMKTP